MLDIVFPLFDFDSTISSDSLEISFPLFDFDVISSSDSLDIEFPLFELGDFVRSSSNMAVRFHPFEPVFSVLGGSTGTLSVSFPLTGAVFTGQRATSLPVSFPLFGAVSGAGLKSSGALAVSFPLFSLTNWRASGPSTSTDYAVWVAHLDAETHSTYTQWPVNSLVRFNGRTLIALPDGIYEITAGKDVSTDVDTRVMWAPSQFGTPRQKNLEAIFAAARRSGSIRIVAVADETEKRNYTVDVPGARSGVGKDRILPGRGLSGSFWQLGVENIDGSDFSLAELEVVTVPQSRRLKR